MHSQQNNACDSYTLNNLVNELQQRRGNDLTPVRENVPAETLPLVQAFNQTLNRAEIARERERRFSADAAHELRSPLAALQVQMQTLLMAENELEREHHAQQILASLARANRLTEQLLVLSRLDPLESLPDEEPLDWDDLARQTLAAVNMNAREKHIRLKYENRSGSLKTDLDNAKTVSGSHAELDAHRLAKSEILSDGSLKLPTMGSTVLVQLMLRNLLDNAIRYSPENSAVTLTILPDEIRVCDEGSGIAAEHMARIRDRFYRPAGQTQSGSGLGLSIIESAAALHGLRLVLENQEVGGLCARLCVVE